MRTGTQHMTGSCITENMSFFKMAKTPVRDILIELIAGYLPENPFSRWAVQGWQVQPATSTRPGRPPGS